MTSWVLDPVVIVDKVLFSSASEEWYTPSHILERVYQVLGIPDLDPCCNEGTPIVNADSYLRKKDNGLVHSWHGRVYLNPPYGRDMIRWAKKMKSEYESGNVKEMIALVPARVDTSWWWELREYSVGFITGRLKFGYPEPEPPDPSWSPEVQIQYLHHIQEKAKHRATFPSAVIYFGKDLTRFSDAFADIAMIYVPNIVVPRLVANIEVSWDKSFGGKGSESFTTKCGNEDFGTTTPQDSEPEALGLDHD